MEKKMLSLLSLARWNSEGKMFHMYEFDIKTSLFYKTLELNRLNTLPFRKPKNKKNNRSWT